MVNIEVDDGNTLDAVVAVHAPRIGGTDGHVVEQTEAVRSIGVVGTGDDTSRSGVVSWRPNGAEGVPEVSGHDLVDGPADTAGSPHGSFEAPTRNGRIGVKIGNGRWMVGQLSAGLADTLDLNGQLRLADIVAGLIELAGFDEAGAWATLADFLEFDVDDPPETMPIAFELRLLDLSD